MSRGSRKHNEIDVQIELNELKKKLIDSFLMR